MPLLGLSYPLLWVEALVSAAVAQLEMQHIASIAVGSDGTQCGAGAYALSFADTYRRESGIDGDI